MSQLRNKKIEEKIYSGIYGKNIGVHIGKYAENINNNEFKDKYKSSSKYIKKVSNSPDSFLGVDDDISGTFFHLNYLKSVNIQSSDIIAKNIINQIVENKTTFWWGGKNNSTEHTSIINLKNNINPPISGSKQINGEIICNQIGGRIFNDIWGLIALGKPKLAEKLSFNYSRITHDELALQSGIFWSIIISFGLDYKNLIDGIKASLEFVNFDFYLRQEIMKIIKLKENNVDIKEAVHILEPELSLNPGGHCHIYPNDLRLFIALIYGNSKLIDSLKILIELGEDTDSNSGNLGCIIGVYNPSEIFKHNKLILNTNDRVIISNVDISNTITSITDLTKDIINLRNNKSTRDSKKKLNFDYKFSTHGIKVKVGTFIPKSKSGYFIKPKNKFINLTMDNHFIKNEINENSYKAYSLPKVSLGQKLNIEIENNNISKFFIEIQTSKGKLELPYKSARNKQSSVLYTFSLPEGKDTYIESFTFIINTKTSEEICINKIEILGNPKVKYTKSFNTDIVRKFLSINTVDNVNFFSQNFIEISKNENFGFINFIEFEKKVMELEIHLNSVSCEYYSLIFNFRNQNCFNEIRFKNNKFNFYKNKKRYLKKDLDNCIIFDKQKEIIIIKPSKKYLDFFTGVFGFGVKNGTVSIKEFVSN